MTFKIAACSGCRTKQQSKCWRTSELPQDHLLLDLLLLVFFGAVGCLLKLLCEPNALPKAEVVCDEAPKGLAGCCAPKAGVDVAGAPNKLGVD